MSKSPFKPGKWQPYTDAAGNCFVITAGKVRQADTIACISQPARGKEIAKFIAAAPELSSALEAARQAIEEASDIMHYEDGECVTHLESRDIERAYIALISVLVQIEEAQKKAGVI